MIEVTEATGVDRSRYDVVIRDGKVSWWVKACNPTNKRALYMGQFDCILEPPAVLTVKFSGTVKPASTEKPETILERTNVIVPGLPVGSRIVKLNAILVPGVGCETPTTHVAGNWPETAVSSTELYTTAEQPNIIVIPAPGLSIDISGIELNADGGKKFQWSCSAKNNESRSVVLLVQVSWTLDTGERVAPQGVSFALGPNESRVIDGAPVRTKRPFREVKGSAVLVKKEYTK
jgi:hypothetical protein